MRFIRKGNGDFTFSPTLWERDENKGPGWKRVRTAPVPDTYDVRFNDVDASSARNAVAGGDYVDQLHGVLTQHWNGSAWKTAVAPVPRGTIGAGFLSVDTRAPGDAWGAGWAQVPVTTNESRDVGLLGHWDGTRWKAQKLPDFGAGKDGWTLESVTALAADNVWAVGGTFDANGAKPLLLHYDGRKWAKVSVPVSGTRTVLHGIAAGPHGTLWAVGETRTAGGTARGLALSFDGRKWTNVALPSGTHALQSVAVSRGAAVVLDRGSRTAGPNVLRRKGSGWTAMKLPTKNGKALQTIDISASGRTIDVAGTYPGRNGTDFASVVLTAQAG
ncbi:hypothetical protein ACZ90_55350 [Streptomyces albus subsp. albus]|nr:hypothetical protein ACZ90_55350 [Streptomyces albus subsp. albus]